MPIISSWSFKGSVCMSEFNKYARVSARLHQSEKEKLKKSGYNARHAIEYFNQLSLNEVDRLSIEEHFLNKEIEELKIDLISKEMRLEDIQKRKDGLYKSHLSELRVKSYQKIIGMFGNNSSKESFDEFITGKYVTDVITSEVISLDCTMEDYKQGLLDYYNDVILVGRTA